LHSFVLAVILSAAKHPEALHEPYRSNLSAVALAAAMVGREERQVELALARSLFPTRKIVISTEAAHSFIVSSAVEKSASLPDLFRSHDVVAVACFSLCQRNEWSPLATQSVRSRQIDVVNDEDGCSLFGGFKFKPKLLLDSSEQGRGRVVGRGCVVVGPLKLEIVAIAQVGLVDNDVAGNPGELFRDEGHGEAFAIEMAPTGADALTAGPGELEFGESKNRHFDRSRSRIM
jgi:hypothetical protein